jgi:hypothetical protein
MDCKGNPHEDEDMDASSSDARTLTICAEWEVDESKAGPSSPGGILHGLDLDLTLAERKTDGSRVHRGVQEESVLVVFELPDCSQGESMFKLGQTVEVLKSFVESEYGIPMPLQTLFLDGKLMLDPLSLLDYPEAKGMDEVCIRVDGPITNEFKK